jgi:hypothetical protein
MPRSVSRALLHVLKAEGYGSGSIPPTVRVLLPTELEGRPISVRTARELLESTSAWTDAAKDETAGRGGDKE